MPTDAYWAVACVALAFCLTLALAYNQHLRRELRWKRTAIEMSETDLAEWRQAYDRRSEQLEATRIALREAQKNDARDPTTGRFVKAG